MAELLHFLSDLLRDDEKQKDFNANPDAVMDAAGLSDAEKAAISSQDPTRVSPLLEKELAEYKLQRKPW